MTDLLILAHAGSWEGRFQVSSLAASAAAAGESVDVALFFAALRAWAEDGWDALDPAPPLAAGRLESLNLPPLSELLSSGRQAGRIRLYACSASTRFLALDPARVQERVDAILGWQSFSQMIQQSARVVTL
jgi:peroxiredoxin family protein